MARRVLVIEDEYNDNPYTKLRRGIQKFLYNPPGQIQSYFFPNSRRFVYEKKEQKYILYSDYDLIEEGPTLKKTGRNACLTIAVFLLLNVIFGFIMLKAGMKEYPPLPDSSVRSYDVQVFDTASLFTLKEYQKLDASVGRNIQYAGVNLAIITVQHIDESPSKLTKRLFKEYKIDDDTLMLVFIDNGGGHIEMTMKAGKEAAKKVKHDDRELLKDYYYRFRDKDMPMYAAISETIRIYADKICKEHKDRPFGSHVLSGFGVTQICLSVVIGILLYIEIYNAPENYCYETMTEDETPEKERMRINKIYLQMYLDEKCPLCGEQFIDGLVPTFCPSCTKRLIEPQRHGAPGK